MEAFSLLKYWRGGGATLSTATSPPASTSAALTTAATFLTAVAESTVDECHETDDDDDNVDDDGPFFDLEFTVPDDETQALEEYSQSSDDDSDDVEGEHAEVVETDDEDDVDGEEEGEFNFEVSSGSGNDRTDPNLTMSPSDDLFFKGKLVPIEPSSIVFNSSEPNSKPQFAGSLLKSATKFRVFMSGLKKSKSNGPETKPEPTNGSVEEQKQQHQEKQQHKHGKFFTVKLKVEEVPIVSMFTRDNSSRTTKNTQPELAQKEISCSVSEESASDQEKRFSKEVVQKYLKMVKPLYVRVSKRYGEKPRLSGKLSLRGGTQQPPEKAAEVVTEAASTAASCVKTTVKPQLGNIPAGLRVVCKHLGKSRSASSAVAAAPSGSVPSQRRDDSLLQQQDGIQSAILHCKRSFNASRDSDSTLLSRSVSDSCNEKVCTKIVGSGKGGLTFNGPDCIAEKAGKLG